MRPAGRSIVPWATALAAWLWLAGAAVAENHLISVGLREYARKELSNLKGPVLDVDDLAAALRKQGSLKHTRLVDRDATREKVRAALERVAREARPGDLVIFHFSGHGSQIPDREGDEEDGKDEVILLHGFDEKTERGRAELIVDDETEQWASALGGKDVRVLVIIDACHAGNTMKSADGAEDPERPFKRIDLDWKSGPTPAPTPLALPPGMTGKVHRHGDLKGPIVYFGAATDDYKVLEFELAPASKERRGLLSWAVARGVEGAADADRDGVITTLELRNYVLQNVRQKSGQRQLASAEFDAQRRGMALFGCDAACRQRIAAAGPPSGPATPALTLRAPPEPPRPQPEPVRAGVIDLDRLTAESRRAVADETVLWSRAGSVFSVFSSRCEALGRAATEREIETFRDVAAFADLVAREAEAGRGLSFDFRPADRCAPKGKPLLHPEVAACHQKRFGKGPDLSRVVPCDDSRTFYAREQSSLVVADADRRFFTILNIAADGKVQFGYPDRRQRDGLEWKGPAPLRIAFEVAEPFGRDLMVVIASPRAADGLHRLLEATNGTKDVAKVLAAIRALLASGDHRIGAHQRFTEP